jgi:hypothetical protein
VLGGFEFASVVVAHVAIFVLLFAYDMIVDFVQQVHDETLVQNAQIQCPQAHAWHHQLFHFDKYLVT